MPGRPSDSTPLQYVGVLAALLGLVGYSVFGWRFGESGGLPFAIGLLFVAVAIGATVYRRL
jgi:hypothetical protein